MQPPLAAGTRCRQRAPAAWHNADAFHGLQLGLLPGCEVLLPQQGGHHRTAGLVLRHALPAGQAFPQLWPHDALRALGSSARALLATLECPEGDKGLLPPRLDMAAVPFAMAALPYPDWLSTIATLTVLRSHCRPQSMQVTAGGWCPGPASRMRSFPL